MTSTTIHLVSVFMAFFAIMNPLANSSLFVSLTAGVNASTRRLIALRAVVTAFLIVATFAISGRTIFSLFGITLPAFRIAGGLMIGLIGFHMLQGQDSAVHTPTQEDHEKSADSAIDLAIVPLGIPILGGPGTIATAMNFAADANVAGIVRILVAFAMMCGLTYLAFIGGQFVTQKLGQNFIKVVARLMGLLLAVVGVQMLIEGIKGVV